MKATAAEADARTVKVAEWLASGWSRARICQYARENEGWELSDSQIDRYIAKARRALQESARDDWEGIRAVANARFEALYGMALEKGDLRLAMSIVKEQVALQEPAGDPASSYRTNEEFMSCLYTYAEALRAVLPTAYLQKVVNATQGLAPVSETFEDMDWYDEAMQQAVEDKRTLGRTRTREELVESGFFDGLSLPN